MTGPDVASALLERELRHEYVRNGWLPLRREGDVVVVGAAQPLGRSQWARVEKLIGSPITVEPMLQSRIVGAVMAQFRADFAFEASEGLAQRDQELSAKTVLSRTQQVCLASVLILLVAAGILGLCRR